MLSTTLPRLNCPRIKRDSQPCKGALDLFPKQIIRSEGSVEAVEVRSGHLKCQKCQFVFPILAGIAVLVPDVGLYISEHVKGIAQVVPESDIPDEYLEEFLEAKSEILVEHIEEDLEAERVIALYLMNHYLQVSPESGELAESWWKPRTGPGSPLMDSLIREYWDHGPFEQIKNWIAQIQKSMPLMNAVELGCGVGGLYSALKPYLKSYIGVDSSFASIALARHLTLGVPYAGKIRIPEDLLYGPVGREVKILVPQSFDGRVDFVLGDLESLPLQSGGYNVSIALNTIDMLEEPARLPAIQNELLTQKGIAIQSCPYIWHEFVAKRLRAKLPKNIQDSARAVEWLYESSGFKLTNKVEHLPWLFFKHVRQMEIYSVHLFTAIKNS